MVAGCDLSRMVAEYDLPGMVAECDAPPAARPATVTAGEQDRDGRRLGSARQPAAGVSDEEHIAWSLCLKPVRSS
jgi:hypothetical protein